MCKSIALIGFMGTGKDTVGRELARHTGKVFASTDRYVELMTGRTIMDIFAREGEDAFRAYEHVALSAIASTQNTVIATGGGIVVRPENRVLVKKSGRVVHLQASLDAIQKRLEGNTTRPLALDHDQVAALYRDREGKYGHADLMIDTTERSPGEIAQRIIDDLGIAVHFTSAEPLTVVVNTGHVSYPVVCRANALADPATLSSMIARKERVCIVTDPLVGTLYLDPLEQILRSLQNEVDHVIVPGGEQAKTFEQAARIFDWLMERRFSRSALLIGLGGGVVSDLTGFVAATFKRGMRCVFLPTTLLGQVDAAIGGKNGINHERGKNMIGTFYQPDGVIVDVGTLRTLSDEEFRNGMSEVIKYGITFDRDLFIHLEQEMDAIKARDLIVLARMIQTCVKIKGAIVAQDGQETQGIRQQLNFGHTIGHAIETLTRYRVTSHGQAVAIGMALEAHAAMDHGDLDVHEYERIIGLIAGYGLPIFLPDGLSMTEVREQIVQDKKVSGGTIALPVLLGIGKVVIKEEPCNAFL
jgi:shikimate kinase/3-dehydroquinate synthase